MIKIPTIFKRNYSETYSVLDEINPECSWVFDNKGTPYRKWQGMAAMIKDGQYFKRYIVKPHQQAPEEFIHLETDHNSGKRFGWFPVKVHNQLDQHYLDAYDHTLPDGTYELIGPKVLGNHDECQQHILMSHKAQKLRGLTRTYYGIKKYIEDNLFEGIVFHHEDGRMGKIKGKDFGLTR